MRDPEFEPAETEPAAEPAPKREPAFNLPGSLVAMRLVLASIQALRSSVLPVDMDENMNRRLSIGEALSNRSVLVFSAIWFLTNFLIGFGQLFGNVAGGTIAWEAHIGGFLFGFLCFPLFDRSPEALRDAPRGYEG